MLRKSKKVIKIYWGTIAGKKKKRWEEGKEETDFVSHTLRYKIYYVLVVCIGPISLYPSWDSSDTMKSRQ